VPGASDDLAAPRRTLLDALGALDSQLDALVLIGAQAIYIWTAEARVALAATTNDSDLAVDRRLLADEPRLEEAMTQAGFHLDPRSPQPGAWVSPSGVPVDLMLPDTQSGAGGRRGARIPPHSSTAVRRTAGLEAAVVDHRPVLIRSLDPEDEREYEIKVASPAALLVAKLHKLGERQASPDRLLDKDAHDIYRLLVAVPTGELAEGLIRLQADPLAGEVTGVALRFLEQLFADGPDALGCMMAGRAEALVGEPDVVAVAAATLATDLLQALNREQR